ncbi:peptidylprolyl isomerase [Candidatus Woesearchaeota archaeon]|nr:hypothetical protein [uncultured archaeon]MBS3167267.1 peptidylprolyl isomerase [Candidatus Woesearchaeota archaeon]
MAVQPTVKKEKPINSEVKESKTAQKFKKNDFIEVEYTGVLKENNLVFDTTHEEIAKKANIYSKETKYGPRVICMGNGFLIKGLEEDIEKNGLGKRSVELIAENAFGKKDPKLLQLVSMSNFKKQNIYPYPGLQINLDGMMGLVRTVSGGRVVVDFNHPLSGKDIKYEINIIKSVTDVKAKAEAILKGFINKPEIKYENNILEIKNKLNKNIIKFIEMKLKELIPEIKEIKTSTLE